MDHRQLQLPYPEHGCLRPAAHRFSVCLGRLEEVLAWGGDKACSAPASPCNKGANEDCPFDLRVGGPSMSGASTMVLPMPRLLAERAMPEGANGRFWQESAVIHGDIVELAQMSYELGQCLLQAAHEYVDLEQEVQYIKDSRGTSSSSSVQPAVPVVDSTSSPEACVDSVMGSRVATPATSYRTQPQEARTADRVDESTEMSPSARGVPSRQLLMGSVRRMRRQAGLIHEGVQDLKQELSEHLRAES